MQKQVMAVSAFVVAFVHSLFNSGVTENPEEMFLRGFKKSYPGWVKDGLLKKPE